MGVDYYAKTVIGIQLPLPDELPRAIVMARKKAFAHHYKDNGETEFDGKTGKKLWLDEKEQVNVNYSAISYSCYDDLEEGQKRLIHPKGMEISWGSEENSVFLGIVIETGSSNGGEELCFHPITCEDLNSIKVDLMNVLIPLNLWDEEKFGIYTILYCSC